MVAGEMALAGGGTFSLQHGDFAARMASAMSPFDSSPALRQAMHAAHLLPDGHTDTLWTALAARIESSHMDRAAGQRGCIGLQGRKQGWHAQTGEAGGNVHPSSPTHASPSFTHADVVAVVNATASSLSGNRHLG